MIYPIGRLEGVEVDLAQVKMVFSFGLIEIMDEKDSHPTLRGIEWEEDNDAIVNKAKCHLRLMTHGWCSPSIDIRDTGTPSLPKM